MSNKVHFYSPVFWASLQGKETVFVILLVCWCAGVTQECAFRFDKCTCFLSGICQCAKLPVRAQMDLTHIGRCFSFYLIESGGIIESVRLNLTITLPSCCA